MGGGGSHGGGYGGGMAGGGSRGGGGAYGGGHFGGSNGFRGGYAGFNGFNRGGFITGGNFRGFRSSFVGGFYSPYYYGGLGFGYGYGPSYYDYSYPYDYGYASPAYSSYPAYNPSPNVTVVYPQQAQSAPAYPVYTEHATPVTREYDQYGQEIHRSGDSSAAAPIYLLAFKDQVIKASVAYWVEGKTLHYVTLQHEDKQAPVESVDRELSMQLNRERRVQFQLPQ